MKQKKSQLKYRLTELIKKLPGTVRSNNYKLCLALDISIQTLQKWLVVEKTERYSIPSDQFYKLAEYLQCNPQDLFNVQED